MKTKVVRNYTELSKIDSYSGRFEYLKLSGAVGSETFGFDRIFNQQFYRSKLWNRVRDAVILRDNGCDLGLDGYEIAGRVIIHHMNPITMDDLEKLTPYLLNPEYLICVSHETHNALHYGDDSYPERKRTVVRMPFDTCPWKT